MIEINATLMLSLAAVLCSIVSIYRTGRKDTSEEVARRAAENATINTKLDQIGGDVRDVKYDVTSVKKDIARLDKELAVVSASTRSAHKRLDSAGIGRGDDVEETK